MHVHLDKKRPDGVAIAFIVMTLLTPFALAILLSRLHADFLKLMPRRSKNRQPLHAVWNGGKKGVPLMQVHMDRKWLDGDMIAFIVISLLIVIAFAY